MFIVHFSTGTVKVRLVHLTGLFFVTPHLVLHSSSITTRNVILSAEFCCWHLGWYSSTILLGSWTYPWLRCISRLSGALMIQRAMWAMYWHIGARRVLWWLLRCFVACLLSLPLTVSCVPIMMWLLHPEIKTWLGNFAQGCRRTYLNGKLRWRPLGLKTVWKANYSRSSPRATLAGISADENLECLNVPAIPRRRRGHRMVHEMLNTTNANFISDCGWVLSSGNFSCL